MTTQSQTGAGGYEARPPKDQPARAPAEIEAEIERTRMRLAATVNAISERVKPANVAHRAMDSAKAQIMDERGRVRTERVAMLSVALAALVGLMVWRRTR
jgi:hypothetical protein